MQSHDERTARSESAPPSTSSDRDPDDSSNVREQLGEAAEDAKAKAKDQGEHYRDVAADEVDAVAGSARAAADELDDDALGGELSRHIGELADGMSRFSAGLREKSADEMVRDVGRTAREHPALFLAGSLAVGFGMSRFARASSRSGTRGSATDAAPRENPASSKAQDRAAKPAQADHTDVAATGGTGRRDASEPMGSRPVIDPSLPESRSDADSSSSDAADQRPRPPYGAPSIQEDRHD